MDINPTADVLAVLDYLQRHGWDVDTEDGLAKITHDGELYMMNVVYINGGKNE